MFVCAWRKSKNPTPSAGALLPSAAVASTCGTGRCSQSRSVRNDGSPTAHASPARIAASTVTGPNGRRPAATRYMARTAAQTPNGAALGRYTRAGAHCAAVASTSTHTTTAPIFATTKFQSIDPLAARNATATATTSTAQPARWIGLCDCAHRGRMPPSASTSPSRSRACP